MDNPRNKQVAWIEAILAYRKWSQTELAREGGIDPSTLSRFLRETNPGATLSSKVVARIEAVGGIPAFETEVPEQPRGLAEAEAARYDAGPGDPMATAISAIIAGRNGVDAWVMKSRALENAGFLPGDILIVDLNATPSLGDAVCAQIYDRWGRAETAFRIYEAPFLTAASLDPALRRPILIGDDNAMVRGVVIASLRPRLTH